MKRLFVLGVSAALAAAGCGDNSRQCGDGTAEVNGVCTGTGTASCGEGTVLDQNTNTCVIDPNACQDGTVLVGTECVDPGTLTPDIEEAVEPNGLGLLGEDSATEAGDILLPAAGSTFVIHGRIEPFQDVHGSLVTGDPAPDGQKDVDADTYLLDVTEPTLITVSVDGLHGLSGAFLSVSGGPDPTLASDWQRLGLNLSGDTSKRQLYLPAAGTYALSITDSRTLLTGEAVEAAAGGLPLDYYVSITTETIAPTALTLTGNVATATGTLASGEVKLFTIAPGLGFNIATLDTPAAQITGSVVVANARGSALQVKGVADEQDPDPALVSALGFKTGDVTTIVADHVENVANEAIDFTLTVTQSPNAALSTTGGDATAGNEPDPNSFTTFFYDVTAANEIDGVDISFDTEVGALVFDENGNLFSLMSLDPFFGFDGMTSYVGHLRHPAAGRYYFAVFDINTPDSTADITATSTITAVTPTAITEGAATGATAVTPFGSKIFTYARGNDPWQQFRSAIAGGGTVQVRLFDPATTFGKLDDLGTSSGFCDPFDTDAQVGDCDDAFPFAFENSAVNNAKLGRIVLDDPTNWLVVINKSNDAGTFNSTIEVRDNMADIGTKNAGDTDTKTGQTLSTAITVQRYIVRTQRDNEVQVDLDPALTLDVILDQVDFDESSLGTIDAAGINGNETGTFVQTARGWTAWTVTSSLPLAVALTFDQTMTINPAAFTVAASATAFADACVGGTTQTLIADANSSFPASDDGMTGNISSPTGFTFFGTASPTFKVSSNGWLTFDTSLTNSAGFNSDLPDANDPNAVVAPYWDDLEEIVVCTKNSGTKVIVQWVGQTFSDGTKVQAQAILDGADNTIEFVWGPNQAALGDSATIGVENAAGDKSKAIGVNQAGVITAASSKKLTPSP